MGTRDRPTFAVVSHLTPTCPEHSRGFALGTSAVPLPFNTCVSTTTAPRLSQNDPIAVVLADMIRPSSFGREIIGVGKVRRAFDRAAVEDDPWFKRVCELVAFDRSHLAGSEASALSSTSFGQKVDNSEKAEGRQVVAK